MWNGKERRGLDKDWVERDRLLTKIEANTTALCKEFSEHVKSDKEDFRTLKRRVFWLTMAVVVIGVILGGPSFAMMFLH